MNIDNVKATFSRKLKQGLKRLNMENQDLAEKIGTTPQAITNYLTMKNFPTAENLVKICKELGISLDAMFENDVAASRGLETYQLISALRQIGFAATDIGCNVDFKYNDSMSSKTEFTITFSENDLLRRLTRDTPNIFIDETTLNEDLYKPQWKAISLFMSRWKKHYEMLLDDHIDRDEYNALMENTLQKAEEIIERGKV